MTNCSRNEVDEFNAAHISESIFCHGCYAGFIPLVRNGSPEQNVHKAVELMGSIEKSNGPRDIVVVKSNAQRFNQGMTNAYAMKGFIDLVLGMDGFSGEIIVAENHQFMQDDCRGWSTDQRNGRFNLNELVEYYQRSGHPNVTKCGAIQQEKTL